jgi:hypothetical protein
MGVRGLDTLADRTLHKDKIRRNAISSVEMPCANEQTLLGAEPYRQRLRIDWRLADVTRYQGNGWHDYWGQ